MQPVHALSESAPTVVKFPCPILDKPSIEGVVERLLLAKEMRGRTLLLDLADVEYATAGGLGGILALRRELQSLGMSLTVHNVKRRVYEVFQMTHLTQILDVCPKQAGQGNGSARGSSSD